MDPPGHAAHLASLAAHVARLVPLADEARAETHAAPDEGLRWRSRARLALRRNDDGVFQVSHYSNEAGGYVRTEDFEDVNAPRIVEVVAKFAEVLPAYPALADAVESCRVLVGRASNQAVLNVFVTHNATAIPKETEQVAAQLMPDVALIVRTSGEVVHAVGNDTVLETYRLSDGRNLQYYHIENFFSNPSRSGAEATLDWLCRQCIKLTAGRSEDARMLELYCGCGTHTVALAPFFGEIVAVELHPRLVDAAQVNVNANAAANDARAKELGRMHAAQVDVVAAPSATFCRRMGRRAAFDVLLVDPPRCGLDKDTIRLAARFSHVLYISCCVENLARDVAALASTHEVTERAVIDHFPMTRWVETAVVLRRRVYSHPVL